VDQAKATLAEDESKLRAAQVGVPLSDLVTESGETSASAGVGTRNGARPRPPGLRTGLQFRSGFCRSQRARRQANNDRAQADLARMKPLVDKAEISQQQYDAYVRRPKVADSELKARRRNWPRPEGCSDQESLAGGRRNRVAQANAQLSTSVANRKQVAIRTADAGTRRRLSSPRALRSKRPSCNSVTPPSSRPWMRGDAQERGNRPILQPGQAS